ncbi:MAG TPA: fumarylacetoacetate hydrolase family protein [Flavitalea sp.]|nr:fumarylacetoacetate hydrolase family protein [Flavitalea sp.]
MKFVSYLYDGHDHLALMVDGLFYEMENLHPDIPNTMGLFLQYWDDAFPMAFGGELMVKEGRITDDKGNDPSVAELIAPVPFPSSFREAFSLPGKLPFFHFLNHHSIRGPGGLGCTSLQLAQLDFTPQVAVVISRHGRNIKAEQADDYIGGFMLLNSFTSQNVRREEVAFGAGPGKSKDFGTATGPWLVSADELVSVEVPNTEGRKGKCWDIQIHCRLNGEEIAMIRLTDMAHTFAELIELASDGVDLYPGDVIGCGSLGTPPMLRLNEARNGGNPSHTDQWLKDGDIVELEANGLGSLTSEVIAEEI